MAQGTISTFRHFREIAFEKLLDLETDAFKVALINAIPLVSDADPRWGAGGTTNLQALEVSGTNYTAGGNAAANPAVTQTTTTTKFDIDNPATWVTHASGPSNIKAAVIYETVTTRAVAFMDLTTDGSTVISLIAGDIAVQFPNGVFEIEGT